MSSSNYKISIAFHFFFVIFLLSLTPKVNCNDDEDRGFVGNFPQHGRPLIHSESIMAQLYRRPELYSSFIQALEVTGLAEPLAMGTFNIIICINCFLILIRSWYIVVTN